jgi:hypothetical protein
MPNILAAVGEHRDDPDHLLLLGEDGLYYDLRLTDGATSPLPPIPATSGSSTRPPRATPSI